MKEVISYGPQEIKELYQVAEGVNQRFNDFSLGLEMPCQDQQIRGGVLRTYRSNKVRPGLDVIVAVGDGEHFFQVPLIKVGEVEVEDERVYGSISLVGDVQDYQKPIRLRTSLADMGARNVDGQVLNHYVALIPESAELGENILLAGKCQNRIAYQLVENGYFSDRLVLGKNIVRVMKGCEGDLNQDEKILRSFSNHTYTSVGDYFSLDDFKEGTSSSGLILIARDFRPEKSHKGHRIYSFRGTGDPFSETFCYSPSDWILRSMNGEKYPLGEEYVYSNTHEAKNLTAILGMAKINFLRISSELDASSTIERVSQLVR